MYDNCGNWATGGAGEGAGREDGRLSVVDSESSHERRNSHCVLRLAPVGSSTVNLNDAPE